MGRTRRIGILGGTFNPIHIGHLIMAQSAYETFHLDKVWIMPTGNPPHKQDQNILDKEIRARMVTAAIRDNHHFELSREELDWNGLVYTADTLERLHQKYPEDEYYFILGADSLFMFDKWMAPERISARCTILACTRSLKEREDLELQAERLTRKFGGQFLLFENPTLEVSSEDIRERVRTGRSIRYLVPEQVEQFIYESDLYQA